MLEMYRETLSCIKIADYLKKEELKKNLRSCMFGNGYWNIYETGLLSYEFSLCENHSKLPKIREHIKNIAEPKILDLMGAGEVIRDINRNVCNIGYGMSVTLVDLRHQNKINYDKENNIDLIEGNIFLMSTWSNINNILHKKNVFSGFDLILCKPQGALYEFPKNPLYSLILLKNAWNLLSKNGMLVSQISPNIKIEDLKKVKTIINNWSKFESEFEIIKPPIQDTSAFNTIKLIKK